MSYPTIKGSYYNLCAVCGRSVPEISAKSISGHPESGHYESCLYRKWKETTDEYILLSIIEELDKRNYPILISMRNEIASQIGLDSKYSW